ncbi:hypothetical protein AV521_04755 [Streptomyces sp. IMTB 2501]|uniref:hypothetical protein n=1 Tax=Streptomyces sp. IMTB 2501 TaxID=1776340 RepID=UPI00096D3C14|nr:hypothetical protein [Streptomyces sp. IMTB 2501]OLZ73392.1 hypothetical protein AV521_04755 [Streptomyces sp. IMTB 2501]
MLTAGGMPEHLFRRTNGVVGLLEKLIQTGCRHAIEIRAEHLTVDLLQRCTVSPTGLPDLDAASGEQPEIPEVPAARKKRPGRNTVFDDDGPAAGIAGGA